MGWFEEKAAERKKAAAIAWMAAIVTALLITVSFGAVGLLLWGFVRLVLRYT